MMELKRPGGYLQSDVVSLLQHTGAMLLSPCRPRASHRSRAPSSAYSLLEEQAAEPHLLLSLAYLLPILLSPPRPSRHGRRRRIATAAGFPETSRDHHDVRLAVLLIPAKGIAREGTKSMTPC